MTNLLFATPWYLLLTLAVIGLVIARSGNQKQQAGPRNVGLGLVGLAVALFGLSFFFETDLAKVKRLNGELIQSVPARDWNKMANLLDADVSLGTVNATLFGSRATLIAGAKADADRWSLKSVTLTRTGEKQEADSSITFDVDVLSMQDTAETLGRPVASSWRLLWEPTGNQWLCHQITCLRIGGESGGRLDTYIK